MFVGRTKEMNILNDLLGQSSSSAMIYGKRKVGKTTLIKNALEKSSDKVI